MEMQEKSVQNMLLHMFSWFHSFCVKHDLRYYMIGGTMLGAARHQGFIPWDDDVDIAMPRSDYARLQELMKEDPSDRYVLETPSSLQPDFVYAFSKIYDTKTTLVENCRTPIKRGIYLDIFPLVGAGSTKEESLRYLRPIWMKLDLLLTLTAGYRPGRSSYKNAAVRLMRIVPKWLLDPKRLQQNICSQLKQKDYDQEKWIANIMGAYRSREMMPKCYFGKPTLYTFEGMQFYGVEDYDSYLTALYGDWRTLPPEEKRVSHHDYLQIDLGTPYLK